MREFSWAEYLELAHKDVPQRAPLANGDYYDLLSVNARPREIQGRQGTGESWDYGVGYEGALKLATGERSWPQGLAEVQRYSHALYSRTSEDIMRADYVYDVEGGELDMGRYLTGEPECFLRREDTVTVGFGNLVHVVVNGAVSGCNQCEYCACGYSVVNREAITARGAAIMALVELLEYSGRAVCLDVVYSVDRILPYKNRYTTLSWAVTLKAYDQPLDVPRCTFMLAHPAAFRRLGFRVMEHMSERVGRMGLGTAAYGVPANVTEDMQGDLYIPHMVAAEYQWRNAETAREWIVKHLKTHGVELMERR